MDTRRHTTSTAVMIPCVTVACNCFLSMHKRKRERTKLSVMMLCCYLFPIGADDFTKRAKRHQFIYCVTKGASLALCCVIGSLRVTQLLQRLVNNLTRMRSCAASNCGSKSRSVRLLICFNWRLILAGISVRRSRYDAGSARHYINVFNWRRQTCRLLTTCECLIGLTLHTVTAGKR